MIFQDDNTYQNVREQSVLEWLKGLKKHEDVSIRGGSKVAYEYILSLKEQIRLLEEKNKLKDEYLKKMKRN